MRAIKITKFGTPDVLQLCEKPLPSLKENEVLIKVHAAGVNHADVLQRQGNYLTSLNISDVPGLEVAGKIVQGKLIGSSFNLGDVVCALVPGGGYAEYCATPLAQCLPVPLNLDTIEAATLPETFFTVWSNVFGTAHLSKDETLLVQGGSSGIGVTAIQLAKALGHRVFATASNNKKCSFCENLGAEICINYKTSDFEKIVKTATNNYGVNVILDIIGGNYLSREIRTLAEDGRLIIIALLGGTKGELDLKQILYRRLLITGSTLYSRSIKFKEKIAKQLQQHVWPLFINGKIKPIIYKKFSLAQANEAHRLMESSTHIGKIVLTLD